MYDDASFCNYILWCWCRGNLHKIAREAGGEVAEGSLRTYTVDTATSRVHCSTSLPSLGIGSEVLASPSAWKDKAVTFLIFAASNVASHVFPMALDAFESLRQKTKLTLTVTMVLALDSCMGLDTTFFKHSVMQRNPLWRTATQWAEVKGIWGSVECSPAMASFHKKETRPVSWISVRRKKNQEKLQRKIVLQMIDNLCKQRGWASNTHWSERRAGRAIDGMDCNGRYALSYTAGHEKIEAKNKELEINAVWYLYESVKPRLYHTVLKAKWSPQAFHSPCFLHIRFILTRRALSRHTWTKSSTKNQGSTLASLMLRIGMSTSTAKLLFAHCQTTNAVWWSAEIECRNQSTRSIIVILWSISYKLYIVISYHNIKRCCSFVAKLLYHVLFSWGSVFEGLELFSGDALRNGYRLRPTQLQWTTVFPCLQPVMSESNPLIACSGRILAPALKLSHLTNVEGCAGTLNCSIRTTWHQIV